MWWFTVDVYSANTYKKHDNYYQKFHNVFHRRGGALALEGGIWGWGAVVLPSLPNYHQCTALVFVIDTSLFLFCFVLFSWLTKTTSAKGARLYSQEESTRPSRARHCMLWVRVPNTKSNSKPDLFLPLIEYSYAPNFTFQKTFCILNLIFSKILLSRCKCSKFLFQNPLFFMENPLTQYKPTKKVEPPPQFYHRRGSWRRETERDIRSHHNLFRANVGLHQPMGMGREKRPNNVERRENEKMNSIFASINFKISFFVINFSKKINVWKVFYQDFNPYPNK